MSDHDGSIVIDTKLDNTDFEKGSDALLAAIKSLTRQIELLGKTIQGSFAGCEKHIVSVTRSMTGTHKAADDIGKDINKLEKDIDRMSSQAEKAINGFKSVFGIHSPSKEMETQGGFIISGLLNGIINGLKNIVSWVGEHILKPIRDAIVAAGGLVVDVVTNLVKGAWGILDSLATTGVKVVTKLDVTLLRIWEDTLQNLRTRLRQTYLNVIYLDPATNTQVTKVMYCSGISQGIQRYDKSRRKTCYDGVSFSLIER